VTTTTESRDRLSWLGWPCVVGGALLFVFSLGFGVWSYVTDFGADPPSRSVAAAASYNAVLFTIFALHHSLFARTGAREWIARRVSPELERSTYVWIASALFLLVCAGWETVPGELWHVREPWSAMLWAAQLAGVAITGIASRQLDVFALAGLRQATKSEGPVALVSSGLYRFVRHPIYFGWVLMVWPTPHMTATRFVFAAVSTIYLAAAIPFEERSLVRHFGAQYANYASRVRWRMVPFLY
jgi:protein-S-isoprenylcysteine O-methyltransferase Ste14